MLKKLTIILFFIATIAQSQHTVIGTMSPVDTDVSWVALYKLQGSKQIFVQNVTIENGVFKFILPETTSKGMYKLRYKMDNTSVVDFIYNNENIELKFDPKNSAETVQFLVSEENIIYKEFITKAFVLQQQLDALQYSYFKLTDTAERLNSEKTYTESLLKYREVEQEFEVKAVNKLASHYIRVNRKYYADTLFDNPQEYLNSVKTHYFDFIDFSDSYLQQSTLISEHILNYVFYLNVSEDSSVQTVLFKNAINEVMVKLFENEVLKADVITTLLYSFSQDEDVEIVNYLLNNYYNKLPDSAKNEKDVQKVLKNIKLAVGQKAPDFSWEEKGKLKSLYVLNNAPTYVLVFWSTSCSHCVIEVPELYEFMKDKSDIHVVDVGLEKDEHGFNIYKEKFEKWTNVLGLGKWENPIAREYEIVSTPTYFILDADKKIIAKPEHLADVKTYFDSIKVDEIIEGKALDEKVDE